MSRTPRFCSCGAMVPAGERCRECSRKRDRVRATSKNEIYGAQWAKVAKAIRETRPLCERCQERGKVQPTQEIHHIVPVLEDPSRKFDESNLLALCAACHRKEHQKTGEGTG